MAYTQPTFVTFALRAGIATQIIDGADAAEVQTPFQLLPYSGQYWGQVMFQVVEIGTVSALVADLEIDMTGVDANFVTLFSAVNLDTQPAPIYNLSGGNVRYRWNITTITGGGSVDIWAIAG